MWCKADLFLMKKSNKKNSTHNSNNMKAFAFKFILFKPQIF